MLPLLAVTFNSCDKRKEGIIFEKVYRMEYTRDDESEISEVTVKIEYYNEEPLLYINLALGHRQWIFNPDEYTRSDNKISFTRYFTGTLNPSMIGHFCTNDEKTSIFEAYDIEDGVTHLIFDLIEVE